MVGLIPDTSHAIGVRACTNVGQGECTEVEFITNNQNI